MTTEAAKLPEVPSREEEIAWAAGLFEGEGCVSSEQNGSLVLMLKNTDHEVVDRFDQIVRYGTLYGPYRNSERDGHKRKPFWVWTVRGTDAYDAMQLLAPWLSKRRLSRALEITGLRFPVKTSI